MFVTLSSPLLGGGWGLVLRGLPFVVKFMGKCHSPDCPLQKSAIDNYYKRQNLGPIADVPKDGHGTSQKGVEEGEDFHTFR